MLIASYKKYTNFFLTYSLFKIYRYKDKNGSIIYTDRIPRGTNEIGVLSKKTGVLKNLSDLEAARAAQEMTEEEKIALETAKTKEAEQTKKDQHLLNTYSSVQDIDKIKQYELEQIDRAVQNDVNMIASLNERITQIEKEIKANPESKKSYEAEIGRVNASIKSANSSLEKNKSMYVEREKKYIDEKGKPNVADEAVWKLVDAMILFEYNGTIAVNPLLEEDFPND